jgi:hypothetical protein
MVSYIYVMSDFRGRDDFDLSRVVTKVNFHTGRRANGSAPECAEPDADGLGAKSLLDQFTAAGPPTSDPPRSEDLPYRPPTDSSPQPPPHDGEAGLDWRHRPERCPARSSSEEVRVNAARTGRSRISPRPAAVALALLRAIPHVRRGAVVGFGVGGFVLVVLVALSLGRGSGPTATTATLGASQPVLLARNPLTAGGLFTFAPKTKPGPVSQHYAKRASRFTPRTKQTSTGRHRSARAVNAAHSSTVRRTHVPTGTTIDISAVQSTPTYPTSSATGSTSTTASAPSNVTQQSTPSTTSSTQSSSSQPAGPTGTGAGTVGSNCNPKCS